MTRFRPEAAAGPVSWDLATALGHLARMAGGAAPPVVGTERDAFIAALPQLSVTLAPLVPDLGGGLLARLIAGPRFDGEPDPDCLPPAARDALDAGEILASADADLWIIEERSDGTARVSHAHPESFEVIAESLGEWLTEEARRLSAARAPKSKKPVGKPAIDAALARLAAAHGADGAEVAALLASTLAGRQDTRWDYLLRAVAACGPIWPAALHDALRGRLLGRVLSGQLHDNEDEACIVEEDEQDLDGVNPVYVGRYPRAARAVLSSGHIVASSGPELWVLLRDAKGAKMSWSITLYHAGYEGFEALGTLEAWLDGELQRLGA